MIRIKKRQKEEVNSSSMADIAFLLLIFFLVTTTIANVKGLRLILPEKQEEEKEIEQMVARNMMEVILNSNNNLLVKGKPTELEQLKEDAKKFLNNKGVNPELSESPQDAIISFKTDRGTNAKTYIAVLDLLKGSYHELRAEYLNISVDEYLKLDPEDAEQNALLLNAKNEYPLTLSEAEPNDYKN